MVDEYGPVIWSEPEVLVEQDPVARAAPSLAPEHDWTAAAAVLLPAFRPVGTTGTDGRELRLTSARGGPGKPIIRAGPAGLPIVYVKPGQGFDVVVGVEHLMAWGVGPDQVHDAAMANLAKWPLDAAWTNESMAGAGWSGPTWAKVWTPRGFCCLKSSPGWQPTLARPTEMFADYVADRARAADEPIDSRVFELVDGELVEPAIATPTSR